MPVPSDYTPVAECTWCFGSSERADPNNLPIGWARDIEEDTGYVSCPDHSVECGVCGAFRTPNNVDYLDGHDIYACRNTCTVTQRCRGCNERIVLHPDDDYEERTCDSCRREWTCQDCGTYDMDDVDFRNYWEQYLCTDCNRQRRHNTRSSRKTETRDEAEMNEPVTCLSVLRNRPIRATSIELEFRGDPTILAHNLYQAGLTEYNTVYDYHARVPEDALVHVEHDSSVDGELIISRANLASQDHIDEINKAFKVFNDLINQEEVWVDTSCGAHTHVDLHGFNISMCETLAHVFGYLEDPIFRIASARWETHRTAENGLNYSCPVPKGPFENRQDFANTFMLGAGHQSALNMEHFTNNIRQNCRCGAVSWDAGWETCVCRIPKCTAEFRVFNGTSNPKKIMAYAALCQSMVAFAKDFPNQYKDLIPMDYPNGDTNLWTERLEWMFKQLPFSPTDRDNLLYCIQHSDLRQVGEDFIEYLRHVEYSQPNLSPQEPESRGFSAGMVDESLRYDGESLWNTPLSPNFDDGVEQEEEDYPFEEPRMRPDAPMPTYWRESANVNEAIRLRSETNARQSANNLGRAYASHINNAFNGFNNTTEGM